MNDLRRRLAILRPMPSNTTNAGVSSSGGNQSAINDTIKGRDLFDLAHALKIFPQLNTSRIVEVLGLYLNKSNTPIGRAEAEKRMFAKLAQPSFITDIGPLLSAEASANVTEGAVRQAFVDVFRRLIVLMPGAAWAKTPEMLERFSFAGE